jgi:hypothetical protein
MRKPRDYDAELKALDDKASQLKERKVRQLGELVIACRADLLPIEELAGALLLAAEGKGPAREDCRQRGERFFQRPARKAATSGDRRTHGSEASGGSAKPPASNAGAS